MRPHSATAHGAGTVPPRPSPLTVHSAAVALRVRTALCCQPPPILYRAARTECRCFTASHLPHLTKMAWYRHMPSTFRQRFPLVPPPAFHSYVVFPLIIACPASHDIAITQDSAAQRPWTRALTAADSVIIIVKKDRGGKCGCAHAFQCLQGVHCLYPAGGEDPSRRRPTRAPHAR